MKTGEVWDLSEPDTPTAPFGPKKERDLPFVWTDWLADIGAAYESHTITGSTPLECTAGTETGGVVVTRVKVIGPYVRGQRYPVNCRIVASDGQKDDQTLWLRIKD